MRKHIIPATFFACLALLGSLVGITSGQALVPTGILYSNGNGRLQPVNFGSGVSFNPSTGTLSVSAAGGTSVGGAVTGGTASNMLYVGAGPVLAQSPGVTVGSLNKLLLYADATETNADSTHRLTVYDKTPAISAYIRYDGFVAGKYLATTDNATLALAQVNNGGISVPGMQLNSGAGLSWNSTPSWWTVGSYDTTLTRSSPGTLAVNGTGGLGALAVTSANLTGIADTAAPNGSIYLSTTHLDTHSAPKLTRKDAAGNVTVVEGGGSGTVTSVGLSLPPIFTVTGSPVTTSGTLTASLATDAANYVFAGPTSGAAAAPTFRALVGADIPSTGLTLAAYGGLLTTDTDGSTITFDLSVSNDHQVTLGGNRTLALANEPAQGPFRVFLIQDATGSRTVTWWSGISWQGGSAPTLSTAAGAVDTVVFYKTGTGAYRGYYTSGATYLTPTGNGSQLTGLTESQISGLTADLAAKAPLASPTFTGVPAAPTATAGTNTAQVATTAFVTTAVAGASGGMTVGNAVTGGVNNAVLYEDGTGKLAASANLTYDGTYLTNGLSTGGGFKVANGGGVYQDASNTVHLDGGPNSVSFNSGIYFGGARSVSWGNFAGDLVWGGGGDKLVFTNVASTPTLILRGAASQTADILQVQDSTPTTLASFTSNGAFKPAAMTDANAPNSSIFIGSDHANGLCWKGSTGAVTVLAP